MDVPYRFFKPTVALRELRILAVLDEGRPISQHEVARRSGVGSTMAHHYIRRLIAQGLVAMTGKTNRTMRYAVTAAGRAYLETLGRHYAREMARLYRIAKQECRRRLLRLYERGLRRVVLFGAAETGELVCWAARETPIEVVGIVDNDRDRRRRGLGGLPVEAPEAIEAWRPDGVVITASRCAEEIERQIRHLETRGIAVARL
ncbi:winged helix-turn-helix transcriptional regulator [Nitrospira sp. Kam-Ns4a]